MGKIARYMAKVDPGRSEECGPITLSTSGDETMHAFSCTQPTFGVIYYVLLLRIAIKNQNEFREHGWRQMCILDVTHITCDF